MGCENSKPEGTKASVVSTDGNDIKDVSSDCRKSICTNCCIIKDEMTRKVEGYERIKCSS